MLRITDARSGELVDAARPRRGPTRVEAHTSGFDLTNLRVLLVADTLVRALELGGTPVWAALSGERDRDELRAGAVALGIRPFEEGTNADEEGTDADEAGPGGTRVIHVAAEGGRAAEAGRVADAPPAADGLRVAVAPVDQAAFGAEAAPGGQVAMGAEAVPGRPVVSGPAEALHLTVAEAFGLKTAEEPGPTALRLALIRPPRSAPCRLDPAALRDAHDTLVRWRRAVAGWARLPSRPVPDDVRARVRAAWEDDLDVSGVLRVLRDVESDPELPDGARFETYAHADRILGVDLARDLGSPA